MSPTNQVQAHSVARKSLSFRFCEIIYLIIFLLQGRNALLYTVLPQITPVFEECMFYQ